MEPGMLDSARIVYVETPLAVQQLAETLGAAQRVALDTEADSLHHYFEKVCLLQLSVPEGYAVDELPKQVVVKLNEEGDGMFEYRISESNGTVSLRSRLRLRRSYFQPEEYEMLREFFNLIVKKHSEQIVFKKKK